MESIHTGRWTRIETDGQARCSLDNYFKTGGLVGDIGTTTKILFMYSQKRNCVASLRIYTFICLWAIYIYSQDQKTYFPAAEQAGGSWEYINRQTPECGNWD